MPSTRLATLVSAAFFTACAASPQGPVDGSASADVAPGSDAQTSPPDATASDAPVPPPDVPTAPDAPRLVSDLAVNEIALFQTVKVTLARDSGPLATTNAPVLAGKPGVLRVYASPGADYTPRPVTAELVLTEPGSPPTVLHDTRTLTGPSSDDAPASVFAFALSAAQLTTTVRYAVRFTDDNGVAPTDARPLPGRLPRDGSDAPLGALADPGGVHVVLIPVRWTGDGSGRLPDTSPTQLATYTAVMRTLYPLTRIDFDVHAPLDFGCCTLTGNVDFSALNQALVDLRQSDNAPVDAYYYALVTPAADFNSYCSRSCVTGQSFVVTDGSDGSTRVGGGVGFTGEDSAWTMAHELGHEHGRTHAPCGVSSSDASYPYSGAHLGVWGFDGRSGSFLAPSTNTDFMGYCDPQWISDYTYAALFARIELVHGVSTHALVAEPRTLRFLHLSPQGEGEWGRTVTLSRPPRGTPAALRVLASDGAELDPLPVATIELSHDEGTFALVPMPLPTRARWLLAPGSAVRIAAP